LLFLIRQATKEHLQDAIIRLAKIENGVTMLENNETVLSQLQVLSLTNLLRLCVSRKVRGDNRSLRRD